MATERSGKAQTFTKKRHEYKILPLQYSWGPWLSLLQSFLPLDSTTAQLLTPSSDQSWHLIPGIHTTLSFMVEETTS